MRSTDEAHELSLPPDPATVREVRQLVRDAFARWEVPATHIAELLASELATNAIIHAGSTYVVTVRRLAHDRIRVEVADCSHAHPVRRHYSRTSGTGRGLGLVEDLAAAWGIDGTADGKRVWFVLDASAEEETPIRDLDADVDLDAVLTGLGVEESSDGEGADGTAVRGQAA